MSKNENQKLITTVIIMFAALLLIPLAWQAITTPQPEVTEAAASEVRLTTQELVVINQQEAELLKLQTEIEKLTIKADNTAKTIEMLKSAKCSYQDLSTCEKMLMVTVPATETPAPDPKVQGAR